MFTVLDNRFSYHDNSTCKDEFPGLYVILLFSFVELIDTLFFSGGLENLHF